MEDGSLAERFLAALPEGARPRCPELEDLDAHLARLVEAAAESWPELDYRPETLVRELAERFPADAPIAEHLAALPAGDLYLAYACARGETRAIIAFEARCLPVVGRALGKLGAPADLVDEVKQILRERFLVGRADKPPAIAGYQGFGSLVAWVRVSAIREYYGLVASRKHFEKPDDDLDLVDDTPAGDLELAFLKREYRGEFKRALTAALAALTPKQRTILRQHYLDRLQVEQLAQLYNVHRVTLSRWLARTRESVIAETRRLLMAELDVDRAEFESILRLIRSQIDLSLRTHLRSRETKSRE